MHCGGTEPVFAVYVFSAVQVMMVPVGSNPALQASVHELGTTQLLAQVQVPSMLVMLRAAHVSPVTSVLQNA